MLIRTKCLLLVVAFAIVTLTNQLAKAINVGIPSEENGRTQDEEHNELSVGQYKSNSTCPRMESTICLKPECIHSASLVLNRLKPEVNPCENFYQFACGNYEKETEILEHEQFVDILIDLKNELEERVWAILKTERPETDPKHFKLPNLLYKACMNTTSIDSLGGQPMKDISDTLGGWPVVAGDSWDSNNTWTWQATIKNFKSLGFGVNYIFTFGVYEDMENDRKHIIVVTEPVFGLNKKHLINGRVWDYYKYMVDVAVYFEAERAAAEKELNESLKFEMDLAKIASSQEALNDATNVNAYYTIKEMQLNYPYIQWQDYINDILPEGVTVNETEVIHVENTIYFKNLGKLLERTSKHSIANYLMWRIHASSMAHLGHDFRKRQSQYSIPARGRAGQRPRWKTCANIVSVTRLKMLLGSLYVRKYFTQDSKAIAIEIVSNVRDAFSEMVDNADWLDDAAKEMTKRKLLAMKMFIGYSDIMLNDDELEKLFHNVEIKTDKYFRSLLNLNLLNMDYYFNKLRLPVAETEWLDHTYPTEATSFYVHTLNSIHLPAGTLQGHLFNANRPKYMNYGAIGFAIGHEISHAFDNLGIYFDAKGKFGDLWHPDSKKRYSDMSKCIIEQYGNFTEKKTGLKINGTTTGDENIADNGGVKSSYLAYNNWLAKNVEEAKLPGLQNYTARQMFWISCAQMWCGKYKTEWLRKSINSDDHSPNEFRVLGPFSNNKDFSRDFQCRDGEQMNPGHKCHVW